MTFILAIMEIEGWFLAETTHYGRIDPAITVAAIKETLKFDPGSVRCEARALRKLLSTARPSCQMSSGRPLARGSFAACQAARSD